MEIKSYYIYFTDNAYDTDNFINDFYDEHKPTPGYESRMAKNDSISQHEIPWNWIIASTAGGAICISIYAIYRWKKR